MFNVFEVNLKSFDSQVCKKSKRSFRLESLIDSHMRCKMKEFIICIN